MELLLSDANRDTFCIMIWLGHQGTGPRRVSHLRFFRVGNQDSPSVFIKRDGYCSSASETRFFFFFRVRMVPGKAVASSPPHLIQLWDFHTTTSVCVANYSTSFLWALTNSQPFNMQQTVEWQIIHDPDVRSFQTTFLGHCSAVIENFNSVLGCSCVVFLIMQWAEGTGTALVFGGRWEPVEGRAVAVKRAMPSVHSSDPQAMQTIQCSFNGYVEFLLACM